MVTHWMSFFNIGDVNVDMEFIGDDCYVNQVKELPSAKHFLDFERWQFLYPC